MNERYLKSEYNCTIVGQYINYHREEVYFSNEFYDKFVKKYYKTLPWELMDKLKSIQSKYYNILCKLSDEEIEHS